VIVKRMSDVHCLWFAAFRQEWEAHSNLKENLEARLQWGFIDYMPVSLFRATVINFRSTSQLFLGVTYKFNYLMVFIFNKGITIKANFA